MTPGEPMDVVDLHDRLAKRAFLHDDPDAYLAGVKDVLDVLTGDLVTRWEPEDARGLRGA